ncbi:MAG TPA: hypothetical protein VKL99_05805 [Candidatus Angelobacter sp.]|nr:hypothetical protein [Candidatus Angelobacter sp.]
MAWPDPQDYAIIMTSGTWLQDHESLAALVFIILSLALIGAFTWLERRFFHK